MTRVATLFVLLVCGASVAAAQTLDPHRIYEQKCGSCHAAHAGDFVWEELAFDSGEFTGLASGRPVREFLEAGHGSLSAEEVDAVLNQFTLIRRSGRLFRTKCRICHNNAVDLARRDLILDGDRLTGRYTGRDIVEFLHRHGRLTPTEVPTMIEVLIRALTTQAPER